MSRQVAMWREISGRIRIGVVVDDLPDGRKLCEVWAESGRSNQPIRVPVRADALALDPPSWLELLRPRDIQAENTAKPKEKSVQDPSRGPIPSGGQKAGGGGIVTPRFD